MERERRGLDVEDPASWDLETGELHPKVPNARVIVSVAFSGSDYRKVSRAAAKEQVRVSRFIRNAALGKAEGQTQIRVTAITSGNPGFTVSNPSATIVFSKQIAGHLKLEKGAMLATTQAYVG